MDQNNKFNKFEKMRHIHHGPFNHEFMKEFGPRRMSYEVKLFTNKHEMVSYVNGLTEIENVEVFKIEDDLYKVLVSRRKCHKHDDKENEV